ncbi:MAG: hypothetical protein P1P90_04420 [Patescibacteria group bacterium]|nr:hypothetical protein [Patescibacteria group bacterium]
MKAKTRKIIGILMIVLPICIFLGVIIAWPLIAIMISQSLGGVTPNDNLEYSAVFNFINVLLGILGLVSMVMIPIGFIAGIILLVKKDNNVMLKTVNDVRQQVSDTNQDNEVSNVDIGGKVE